MLRAPTSAQLHIATLLLGVFTSVACGGSGQPSPSTTTSIQPQRNTEPSNFDHETGIIQRADLTIFLERGLGYLLQDFDIEPHLVGGRFEGFRLNQIHGSYLPAARRFLRPGDILCSVNGFPIERPEQAIRIWRSLRVASTLMLAITRKGRPKTLRFTILETEATKGP